MKYTSLSYQKNFHTDSKDRFLMETIVLVVEVEENDIVSDVAIKANKMLCKIHAENNPGLYLEKKEIIPEPYDESMRGTSTVIIDTVKKSIPIRKLTPTEVLIRDIENCTEMAKPHGLLSYEKISTSNSIIKASYDLQLLKLKK